MKSVTTVIVTLVVIAYALIGGVIFQLLERDNETTVRMDVLRRLDTFLENNTCMTEADLVRIKQLLDIMFMGGLSLDSTGTLINGTRWDYETSIFVSIELLATVGYTKAAPKTTGGRVFAICLAFLGIPAFLLSAIGLGKLLNLAAEALIRALSCLCRRKDDDGDEFWPEDGRPPPRMPRAARKKFFRRRAVYRILIITVVGAGLFVFVPSAIFMQIEQWTYWEAAYYCAITLISIGFGDFVPGYGQAPLWITPGWYRLAVGCYIVIVIGWFAGVVAAFRSAIYAFAHKAETRIAEVANAVFHITDPQEPELYVSQTGKTSVVNILPPDSIKDAIAGSSCRPHDPSSSSSPIDGSVTSTRPRTDFACDVYNSRVLTSSVRVFNS